MRYPNVIAFTLTVIACLLSDVAAKRSMNCRSAQKFYSQTLMSMAISPYTLLSNPGATLLACLAT